MSKKTKVHTAPKVKKTTKTQQVALHLKANKTITSLEAINLYGATRLAAIIFNLRHSHAWGWTIRSIDKPFKDRYGNAGMYAEYTLLSTNGKKIPKVK